MVREVKGNGRLMLTQIGKLEIQTDPSTWSKPSCASSSTTRMRALMSLAFSRVLVYGYMHTKNLSLSRISIKIEVNKRIERDGKASLNKRLI